MSNPTPRLRLLALLLLAAATPALADSTAQTLPFSQNWSNTGQITTNDNWSGVAGIEGYLGQDITTSTGANPGLLLGVSAVANDLDVIANQTNPNTLSNGGVAEFDLTDDVVALNGSGTADAPYILIHLNTTGATGINVAYNLRDLDGSVDNAVQPVALQYRVGSSGSFTNVAGGFVADATTGPSLATLVTAVSATLPAAANNQSLVQVRIITANAVGNDEWVGIDDISVTAASAGTTLSINDVTATEGDAGTTNFVFTVSLNQAAGVGGVTFNIATADGTAQDDTPATEDNDYVAQSLTSQSIAQGASTYQFTVAVNGDAAIETNETFFVNIDTVVGATASDAQGLGTISNDDVVLTPIHDVQGAGNISPFNTQIVHVEGIVTARRFNNGFYMQAPDAEADANPATSEGIFVFTSSAPPAAAAIGNRVRVSGTAVEFTPSSNLNQLSLTEIGSVTAVTVRSTGNALPTPVSITGTQLNAAGPVDNLERYEGMRATFPSLTVIAPNDGNINEANATATSNFIFWAVPTGVARPFREAGVGALDVPAPAGTVPRFDTNPERLQIVSRGQIGATGQSEDTGTVITNLVGVIDYGFGSYQLLPDAGSPYNATGGMLPTAVTARARGEITVAGFNLLRFFDNVNDPAIGDPVLTLTAYNNRLKKTANAICQFLKTPDILGVVEVENLTTLQALANAINTNVPGTCASNPQYVAYLMEGNDVGGIDVGFLVSTAASSPSGPPRITVGSVSQLGKTTLFTNADLSTELLNDRPSLLLTATVAMEDGSTRPLTVIVNHLRSLNGINDNGAGSNGWATVGDRVRAKRQAQAVYLAQQVQARQAANPSERIVLVGDFNAFEFSDGYADMMGTILGTPSADAATVVPGDGADLVTPNLVNLTSLSPATDRYSFSFEGSAQTLDHILVNQAVIAAGLAPRSEHARINADFGNQNFGDFSVDGVTGQILNPLRVSDHDPVVLYLADPALARADLMVSAPSALATGTGGSVTQPVTLRNLGPVAAAAVSFAATVSSNLGTASLVPPTGWTCTEKASPGRRDFLCSTPYPIASGQSVVFPIRYASPVFAAATLGAAAASTTPDPNTTNNRYSGMLYSRP